MLTEAQNLKENGEKSSVCGASAEDIMSAPVIVRASVGSFEHSTPCAHDPAAINPTCSRKEWRDWHPLYWLRTERGWTLRELADRSGLAPFQIQAYERGSTMPRIDSAFKLAQALGVTVDKLFGIPWKRAARHGQR